MARIGIFFIQVRVQHRVKTKLHDKQVDSTLRVVTLPRRVVTLPSSFLVLVE